MTREDAACRFQFPDAVLRAIEEGRLRENDDVVIPKRTDNVVYELVFFWP